MALSGDLNDFSLLQLLTLVQVTGKTGALTLQRPRQTAVVFFENGQLTKVLPPESRHEGLATALYRAGRIDHDLYELVTSQMLPSEKAIGLLVVDQGTITQEEIVEFVRERHLAQLFLLLTWPEGTFRFEVGVIPSEGDIVAPTDLAPVLDRGRAYLEEWEVLVSQIPDLDRPVRLLPEPERAIQEVCLSLAEWSMVAAISGSGTLREVAEKLALDEFTVRQVAYSLLSAGLMEVVAPEVVQPEPTRVAPTEPFRTFRPTEPPPPAEPEPPAPLPPLGEPEQPRIGAFARLFGRK